MNFEAGRTAPSNYASLNNSLHDKQDRNPNKIHDLG